jgi:hypothetical protein
LSIVQTKKSHPKVAQFLTNVRRGLVDWHTTLGCVLGRVRVYEHKGNSDPYCVGSHLLGLPTRDCKKSPYVFLVR